LVIETSESGFTVVVSSPLSLAPFGSSAEDATPAVSVTSPAVSGVSVTSKLSDPPSTSVANAHRIIVPARISVHRGSRPETVTLAGTGASTTTSAASDGPSFVTVTVSTTSSPTSMGSTASTTVTPRSATNSTTFVSVSWSSLGSGSTCGVPVISAVLSIDAAAKPVSMLTSSS
jgi:hypothetical protein